MESTFKNGPAARIATHFNLECFMETPVGSFEALKTWLECAPGGGRCSSYAPS
jgi:hypothetical protein